MGPADDKKGRPPRVPTMSVLAPAPMSPTRKVDPVTPKLIMGKDHHSPLGSTRSTRRANQNGSIHGMVDETRFQAHVESQLKAIRLASDSLRDIQASTSRLEAQAAANDVQVQVLVS
ncbi:hypothetical protein JAAARDRAFT_199656 [Jaapia argillacea MUCL 33604]|uniref:Uncharacterized protein n=1 Tax=Jaapia argillacea MUCL 33604 TaxID=933084 RepID=A0A067PK37_9AGAM|nr:hypothetical protein JAAARDRAFT_199656 [Jaapia argillacea MUCL 33604]